MRTRTYTELSRIRTFEDRYDYLALRQGLSAETFGFDRFMNQEFYRSKEWRDIRHHVIARDRGCDLGVEGHEIHDKVYIHHMNPMTPDDIKHGNEDILEPEYLITTTHRTHNAIHYGTRRTLPSPVVQRRPGDTKLW